MTWHIQQLLSEDIASRENDQVRRPLFQLRNRVWRILITADRNRETIELRDFPQAAKDSLSVLEQRLEVGITQL